MSHPYQLWAFLFHNSRIEPEPPLPRRTHGALCMVYLYLHFSIAPLYLAQLFLYTRAGVRAPTRAHTALYMIPLAVSKGVFSLIHHYLYNLTGFLFFFPWHVRFVQPGSGCAVVAAACLCVGRD